MKKVISVLICVVLLLGAMPSFAESEPFTVVSEFNDGETMGKSVVVNEKYHDFTLFGVQKKGDTILQVETKTMSEAKDDGEFKFDYVQDAEVEIFAWDSEKLLQPAREDYRYGVTYENVMELLKKANDYWITENSLLEAESNPWQVGVFHTGNMQAYYMTGDELYRNYSTKWSEINNWQYYTKWNTDTNADNMCCYQTYIDLYNIDKDENYLNYVKSTTDKMINSTYLDYWSWIDTFYMAGPVFTKMYELTGDEKYLDKMYNMIKYTAENLNCYDEDEGLWYRDAGYIGQKSDNGGKVFWSRGDGWVYAAFARIIEELPDGYEHKDYFVNIFKEMSKALKLTQCEEGAWHESLMDIGFNPDCEESGTGFFVYGMMWGINNGYLDEDEYVDCAFKGWRWLCDTAMREDGHIGFVQHIGAQPTKYPLTMDNTENYAYANFVFAASEVSKYLGGLQGDMVPYLQKKLLGNIEVYKMDSPYYIKNGEIHEFSHPMIIEEDGDVKIVKDYMYVLIEDYLDEGEWWYCKDGVYVKSEFITPFNKTEENLVKMLSDILDTGKFPERAYSDPDRIEIKEKTLEDEMITVSQWPQEANAPSNMIDGNLYSYWTAYVSDVENPAWAEFDLGEVQEIDKIAIAFNKGNERSSEFSVSVSEDGESYIEVLPKQSSSGETLESEIYEFEKINARYVKLFGYGNSTVSLKYWFSPSEVSILSSSGEVIVGSGVDTSIIKLTSDMVTASQVLEEMNAPENMVDGNVETRWAADCIVDGVAPFATFDLKEVYEIDKIGIAFYWGDSRTYNFEVKVSEDGINYQTVIEKRKSVGKTLGVVKYDFDKVKARYVRIYGYGNSLNNWFNPTEVQIFKVE